MSATAGREGHEGLLAAAPLRVAGKKTPAGVLTRLRPGGRHRATLPRRLLVRHARLGLGRVMALLLLRRRVLLLSVLLQALMQAAAGRMPAAGAKQGRSSQTKPPSTSTQGARRAVGGRQPRHAAPRTRALSPAPPAFARTASC